MFNKQTQFWHKHNTYKAWAWSTLGVGLACGTAAVIIVYASDNNNEDYRVLGTFCCLCYGGGLACIASIPLFIQSHRYKVKAKKSVSLSLNATTIPVSSPKGKYEQILALGFAISL